MAFACGDPEIVNNLIDGGQSSGGSNGAGGTGSGGASSGGSGGSTGIDLDGSFPNGGGAGDGTIDPDAACGTGTAEATLTPLNLFIMFDRSFSMDEETTNNGPTRWEVASTALSAFFASPEADGLKIALRFFGYNQPEPGCNGTACDIDACAIPNVALGTLTAEAAPADTHEAALLQAIEDAEPQQGTGSTPIFAALGGAVQWAINHKMMTPDETTAIIFVTDGDPQGCEDDFDLIAAHATEALAAGVSTYAIGLTGNGNALNPDLLNQIAAEGGTTEATFIADGDDTEQQLLDKLNAIRGESLDCDFPMPVAMPGRPVDPAKINVNFTPSGGTQATFGQVQNAGECGTLTDAWYYDDPADPTRIVLCEQTCAAVQADGDAKLEILLGCEVKVSVPQ